MGSIFITEALTRPVSEGYIRHVPVFEWIIVKPSVEGLVAHRAVKSLRERQPILEGIDGDLCGAAHAVRRHIRRAARSWCAPLRELDAVRNATILSLAMKKYKGSEVVADYLHEQATGQIADAYFRIRHRPLPALAAPPSGFVGREHGGRT